MKKDIHPKYVECKVTCGCGNTWTTRSTVAALAVEVCSNCHPFFTGQQKFIDTAGRVERFQKKYAWDAKQVVTKADEAAKEAAKAATKAPAKPKRKPPIALTLHTTSVKGKSAPKTLETIKGEGKGMGMGGRPAGPGGPGGGRAGGGGGRGGRGGRGPKKGPPVSTERQRIGKPKAAETPPPEAPPAEAPKPETPAPEAPKADAPKPTEGQA